MEGNCFTILWWFLPYINICQMYTHVLPSWAPSHLLLHSIPLGCSRTSALGALLHASNLHWSSILHMVIYMFQCCSLISAHPCLLPHSPKVCSLTLCLFCFLAYRVVVTAFLSSIYICFSAILPNHPTLALSHRVQKTVLYICVSFAVSHTGLSLPSF